jgi:redox-sensitive bicupin YhaK (pirin superfamily)
MVTVRPAGARGRTRIDWLDSRHTFSFGEYHDPRQIGFRSLRVINDDRVAPGAGFPTHAHRDMEIITYVLSGALAHKDSLGTGSVISAGDVQIMSAGTGIRHSEFNPSPTDPVHFLQIWVFPERQGLPPRYDQKTFADDDQRGRLRLIASREGRDGSLTIFQDVNLFAASLSADDRIEQSLRDGRSGWLQIARGAVALNGVELEEGDGAAITGETQLVLSGRRPSEVLLFDLG